MGKCSYLGELTLTKLSKTPLKGKQSFNVVVLNLFNSMISEGPLP